MKLAIIGTGHVGLVTGACFADVGHQVICVDHDFDKIALLERGGMPIYEPGLEEIVKRNVDAGRLRFTGDLSDGVNRAEVIFIAVPTPPRPDGSVDMSFVEKVAREIAGAMTGYKIVVDKSTVPLKTGEKVAETIKRYNPFHIDCDVVSNPEFLREGSAVKDLMQPDRIVIGVSSDRPVSAMMEIYAPFAAPVIITDVNSAELIKHACNSFLALKISYINAIAAICEASDADVADVAHGMGLDPRIGRQFLDAGLGYGGSCFPKDLSAFVHIANQVGYDFRLLKEVAWINADTVQRFVRKVHDMLWTVKDKRIAVLGLAFKANTDDMRNAASLEIIAPLLKEGARIRVYDPKAMAKAREFLAEVEFCESAYAAATDAEAVILCTEWEEFKQLDLKRLRSVMAQPHFLDGRNLFDPQEMEALGFIYRGVGRASARHDRPTFPIDKS